MCRYGELALVQSLLSAHADASLKDDQKRTALHCAATHGHAHVAMTLVNVRYTHTHTHLSSYHCISVFSPQYCASLLNAIDEDGKTALICAAEQSHADVVSTLLEVPHSFKAEET